jgi:GNAT superfamily N-acetyltransferase
VLAQANTVASRISQCEDALAEAGGEVLPLDVGRVILQPEFPHVYDANVVRRARLRPEGLDAALERLAAPLVAIGARHLQLTLDGADVPDAVAPCLRARGFERERLLAMVLDGPPEREATPGVALRAVPDERGWDDFSDAMDRMNREEPWYARGVSLEIVGSLRRKCERGRVQVFVATLDGRAAGVVGLAEHRGAAAIFSVGTFPELRRRGVGRSLVLGAVDRARARGADLIYLVARADDWPREMYARLGFRVELGFDVWLRLPR